jgi:hypothetical protein
MAALAGHARLPGVRGDGVSLSVKTEEENDCSDRKFKNPSVDTHGLVSEF